MVHLRACATIFGKDPCTTTQRTLKFHYDCRVHLPSPEDPCTTSAKFDYRCQDREYLYRRRERLLPRRP